MPQFEWPKHGFLGLLVCLTSLLVIFPFFYKNPYAGVILSLFISAILIFSVYAFSRKRQSLIIALVLAVPTFLINWGKLFFPQLISPLIEVIFPILFFGYILSIIFIGIFKAKKVTTNLIFGSICIYLLIGLVWAFIYSLLEILSPGSFQADIPGFGEFFSDRQSLTIRFVYFSYVTLTTLGYGDISPVTPPAQLIASLEAIAGQFYLAILVARLIGMHLFEATKSG
jgi:voltage-gated potassium channel Kch